MRQRLLLNKFFLNNLLNKSTGCFFLRLDGELIKTTSFELKWSEGLRIFLARIFRELEDYGAKFFSAPIMLIEILSMLLISEVVNLYLRLHWENGFVTWRDLWRKGFWTLEPC
jgi:hypothetical protein